ncbi:MAG: GDSL-lilke lipase/acylhydrolase family protein [Acidobacteria bacterium]|nr:GDSL-lilke lipase/acylhydrolase family protein [Acidobacteriota bacterium]
MLLGDSIFDNRRYTAGEPDVVTHLQRLLPAPWRATLAAVDGATTARLAEQLARVPADASHLVISIGGNDAVQNSDLLTLRVASSAEALQACGERVLAFERRYRQAIEGALKLGYRTAVCTVYNGALGADVAAAARVGLTLFNDAILRTAADLRIDVLELRHVCTEPADYANPIEPSGRGGLKIAAAIGRMVGALPAPAPPAQLWT